MANQIPMVFGGVREELFTHGKSFIFIMALAGIE